jgi:hypothetical protein
MNPIQGINSNLSKQIDNIYHISDKPKPLNISLEIARKWSGLSEKPFIEVINSFLDYTTNGKKELTRINYLNCFRKFIPNNLSIKQSRLVDVMIESIFYFLANKKGVLNYVDCMIALSIFTSSSHIDKIKCIFNFYNDVNAISYNNLLEYLSIIYKTMNIIQPECIKKMGVTPTQLAESSCNECYTLANIYKNEKLPLIQLQNWYNLPVHEDNELEEEKESDNEYDTLNQNIIVWYGNSKLGEKQQYHSVHLFDYTQAEEFYKNTAHGWINNIKGNKSKLGVGNTRIWYVIDNKNQPAILKLEKGYNPPYKWRRNMRKYLFN